MNDQLRTAEEWAQEYRAFTLEWQAARESPPEANRVFDKRHALFKRMREFPEGHQALMLLMEDPEIVVRLSAASHSLWWRDDRAVQVLREIEESDHAGLYAVDAKWTLREYERGKLNLDW